MPTAAISSSKRNRLFHQQQYQQHNKNFVLPHYREKYTNATHKILASYRCPNNKLVDVCHNKQRSMELDYVTKSFNKTLSYDEYFLKINQLCVKINQYWLQDQKVRALKILIQCVKLLEDTEQLKLYPKKYRMITSTLDQFGQLVNNRLESMKNASEESQRMLPTRIALFRGTTLRNLNFQRALETCKNWLLKVATIHELVPRFYIEVSLLQASRILVETKVRDFSLEEETTAQDYDYSEHELKETAGSDNKSTSTHTSKTSLKDNLEFQHYEEAFSNLSDIAWGIGDITAALHARLYLCKTSIKLMQSNMQVCGKTQKTFELLLRNIKYSLMAITRHEPFYNLNNQMLTGYPVSTLTINDSSTVYLEASFHFEMLASSFQSILSLIKLNFKRKFLNTNDQQQHTDESSNVYHKTLTPYQNVFDLVINEANRNNASLFGSLILMTSLFKVMPAHVYTTTQMNIVRVHQTLVKVQSKLIAHLSSLTITSHQTSGLMFAFFQTLCALGTALQYSSESNRVTDKIGEHRIETFNLVMQQVESLLGYYHEISAAQQSNSDQTNTNTSHPMWLDYGKFVSIWLTYASQNLEFEQVDLMLSKFLTHIHTGRKLCTRYNYATLSSIIKAPVLSTKSLKKLESLSKCVAFSRLLDLLNRDEYIFEVCRWFLDTVKANLYANAHSDADCIIKTPPITDESSSNLLLDIISKLNNTVCLLVDQDELEQVSKVVAFFLNQILISRQQLRERSLQPSTNLLNELDFLCRCRSSTNNLDLALIVLIQIAFKLPTDYKKVEKLRRLRISFLNSCLAFALVTIPALHSNNVKFEHYIRGLELSLKNATISMADMYIKQALLSLQKSITADDNGIKRKTETNVIEPESVEQLLDLVTGFEENIDLKSKFELAQLINEHYSTSVNIVEKVR